MKMRLFDLLKFLHPETKFQVLLKDGNRLLATPTKLLYEIDLELAQEYYELVWDDSNKLPILVPVEGK